MRNAKPDRLHPSEEADTSQHQASPEKPRGSRLSHRQARGALALLLDATTAPAVAGRLRQHVDGCARCQGELEHLRQAEGWLLAQPVEVPRMVAAQQATWAAIQARIAVEDAPAPVVEKALSNGHTNGHNHHLNHQAIAEPDTLVPLVTASADADVSELERPSRPLPVPLPPAPVMIALHMFGKSGSLKPRRAFFVALAASLIVGSFAALFLAHYSANDVAHVPPTSLFSMGVLDPGSQTTTFSFDPVSRRLLTLSGEMSYACLPGAHCPYSGPPCLSFSLLDVGTGHALKTVQPTCTPGGGTLTSTTFINLFDDSARGQALLVGSDQQVTAVNTQSGAIIGNYALACCSNDASQQYWSFLDQHDQLLLTAAESGMAGVPDTLVAQDATTGALKYHASVDVGELQASLVSNVTGWLYFWNRCAANSDASCVEVYAADSGQKVTGWEATSQQTPLAADPTENILYVRADYANGQSETLAVDGQSGQTVDHLPAAQAMAINAPLHHAYLLGEDGVTVVDTRTRRKLSTLPVLAHDESWVAPAVDAATSQLYLPIQRGKLLRVQDNAAGELSLRSTQLEVVLEAERAMMLDQDRGAVGLYPWELPLGPGSSSVYHPMLQKTQSDCGRGWVAARSTAALNSPGGGRYTVQLSLAWDDHFAKSLTGTPASESSYPHQHSWLYTVPANGDAWLSGQQGETFPNC